MKKRCLVSHSLVWYLPRVRRGYVDMAHFTLLYGSDETEFSKKLRIVVKPPIRRDETGGNPPYVEINVAFRSSSFPTQRTREDGFLRFDS